jgi:hypothetical protein
MRAQPVGRSHQVIDVGAEVRVREVAAAAAEPGEVEAQHAVSAGGQRLGDGGRRLGVLGAGEAVGEDSPRTQIVVRRVQATRQGVAQAAREFDALARHVRAPRQVQGESTDTAAYGHREAGLLCCAEQSIGCQSDSAFAAHRRQ